MKRNKKKSGKIENSQTIFFVLHSLGIGNWYFLFAECIQIGNWHVMIDEIDAAIAAKKKKTLYRCY